MAIRKTTTSGGLRVTTDPSTGKITGASDSSGSYSVDSSGRAVRSSSSPSNTASSVTAPTVATATPKSLGLSYSPDPQDSEIDARTKALISSYGTMPDEKQVRSKVLSQFQGEIDALDRAAAQARASITQSYAQTEKENTGTDAAIQARRGLLGSDFGSSQTQRVVSEVRTNRDQKIGDSDRIFNTQKSSLLTQARTMANDEYNKKLEAYRLGAGATIQYLKDRQLTAKNNALQLAKQAYMSKIDLSSADNELEVRNLAQQVGVAPEALKQIFMEYKATQDAAKAEAQRKMLLEDRTYNLDVEKENRERSRLNFDMSKFEQEYALNKAKTEAEINKINNDIANGGANDTISDEFAAKYGLPMGTKKGDLAGFIPGQNEKVDAAKTELDNRNEILSLINDLKNDKDGQGAMGNSLGLNIPRNIQGTAQYNWKLKFDRLKNALALNEAGKLKGSGAVSDAERELLAKAASALDINSKDVTLEELDRIEQKARTQAERINTFLQTSQTSSLMQEFESSQGGSEGTNPKAQSTTANPTSLRLPDTKQLASAVVPRFPQGTNLGNKEGQCITFLHKIANFPSIGDGKEAKVASLNSLIKKGQGLPANQLIGNAKVGMILISNDNKTYGHGSMINAISADGRYARLTESNRLGKGLVTHTRVVALNSPSIYGAIIPTGFKNIS